MSQKLTGEKKKEVRVVLVLLQGLCPQTQPISDPGLTNLMLRAILECSLFFALLRLS
jgi:hypothetical protein